MYSAQDIATSSRWVAPFGNSRITGCLPPPRDLSQAATSFISSSLPSHPPYALTCFGHPMLQPFYDRPASHVPRPASMMTWDDGTCDERRISVSLDGKFIRLQFYIFAYNLLLMDIIKSLTIFLCLVRMIFYHSSAANHCRG